MSLLHDVRVDVTQCVIFYLKHYSAYLCRNDDVVTRALPTSSSSVCRRSGCRSRASTTAPLASSAFTTARPRPTGKCNTFQTSQFRCFLSKCLRISKLATSKHYYMEKDVYVDVLHNVLISCIGARSAHPPSPLPTLKT